MREILLYHGSKEEVVYPEIRITRYTKDFSWGFYCTNNYQQAYRWADRRSAYGIVNIYRYVKHPTHQISFHTANALRCLTFERSEHIHDGKTDE